MGRVIKFAIVVLAVYAAWQAGSAQWDHFEFQDAVRQLTEFGGEQPDEALRIGVIAAGAKVGILLVPANVGITRVADHLYVNVSYTRPVQLLPWYRYNWPFSVKIDRWFIPGGRFR